MKIILTLSAILLLSCSNRQSINETVEPIPVLLGSWADPTILRVDDNYYMTQSMAGGYVPNFLIWHSTDLLHWKPLSYARSDKPSGLAPDLAYVNGTYYLYCENTSVLTASSPSGPWEEHGRLEGSAGIDPGHFTGYDGKRYLYTSKGMFARLSDDGLSYVQLPENVYDGWKFPDDWAVEGFHLESPKIFKKDNMYFMISAQGGTFGPATAHMAVTARSKNPGGPWENSPYNPLIRTKDRDEPYWTMGHATVFEGPEGNWFALFHGYKNGYRLLGRSTLLLPVSWTTDGWPVIADQWPAGFTDNAVMADLPESDEFNGDAPGIQWQSYRKHDLSRYAFKKGWLSVMGRGDEAGDSYPLTINNGKISYEIETEVELKGSSYAGLVIFYSPDAYVSIGLTSDGIIKRGYKAGDRRPVRTEEFRYDGKSVKLKIVNEKSDVRFYFLTGEGKWQMIESSVDITLMNDNGFFGNSSMRPGIFACGPGGAGFNYFRFKPLVK